VTNIDFVLLCLLEGLMKISSGKTRFVIVARGRAYKYGKTRLIRSALRVPFLVLSKRLRLRFLERYGKTYFRAMMSSIFAGLIANRIEYSYWQRSRDKRVVPTTKMLFCGFVIIQEEATPVTEIDLEVAKPFGTFEIPDAGKAHQFGRHSGTIKLVDYGETPTCRILEKTA